MASRDDSVDVLIPAYDDAQGVTAAFNLNLLKRINRELDGTFDLDGIEDVATANNRSDNVTIWQGVGDGTLLGPPIEVPVGYRPQSLVAGDLNGDGKPDMVTGKRLFAHHGSDIGAFEPLYAFWYDIQGGKFERHVLSFNHLPYYPDEGGLNPPPNDVVSVGMKLNIADMDKDGRNDVVIAGKGGLYVFYSRGTPPTPRRAHKLSERVVKALLEARAVEPALSSQELMRMVKERFGVSVHRRSIERALARQEKKRR